MNYFKVLFILCIGCIVLSSHNQQDDSCITLTDRAVYIQQNNKEKDSLNLISLYNATDGEQWVQDWKISNPISTWTGISFNIPGRVQYINLDGRQITTTNPDLSAPGNNLMGELPNLCLDALLGLYIINSNLSGNLPMWEDLPELNFLNLAKNNLSGVIPSFDSLTNLRNIDLSSNQLHGTIPGFNFLDSIRSLRLHDNKLDSLPIVYGQVTTWSRKVGTGLKVSNNKLTFDDILPNLSAFRDSLGNIESDRYHPQKKIEIDSMFFVEEDKPLTINTHIDHTIPSNEYKWVHLESKDTIVVSNNKLVIDRLKKPMQGKWKVMITNDSVPDLVLESNTFEIVVLDNLQDVLSPNDDGYNDHFEVFADYLLIDNIDLKIINRWGDVVFSEYPYRNYWNGKSSKGDELPEGTYIYSLSYMHNDTPVHREGHITLLR